MKSNKHFIIIMCLAALLISVCNGCMRPDVRSDSPKVTEVKSVTDEPVAPIAEKSSNGFNIQDEGSYYLISLPDNTLNQVESCSLSILGHGDNGYLLLIYDREEKILKNGTIHVSKDQPILTMLKTDMEQSILIPDVKEELTENGTLKWTPDWIQYVPRNSFFECGLLNATVFEDEANSATLAYKTNTESIEGYNPLAGTVGLDYWNNVRIIYKYIEDVKDSYGNTQLITSNSETGKVYSISYPFEDVTHDLRFKMSSVTEIEGTYYGQINVSLRNGESICTNLFLLNENGEIDFPKPKEDELETAEVRSDAGIMRFDIHDDYASVTSYNVSAK